MKIQDIRLPGQNLIPVTVTDVCVCVHTISLWSFHCSSFQPDLKSAAKCDLMCILKWNMIGMRLLPVLPATRLYTISQLNFK